MMSISLSMRNGRKGLPARRPFAKPVLLRFRPIMMTTMAALLSALPLMLGTGGIGTAASFRITMVGGLILSQLLTLFTTPVIYLAFDRLKPAPDGRSSWVSQSGPNPGQDKP